MSSASLDRAEPARDDPPVYLPLRKVVAVGIGNALEFYDFLTFSFFAIQIGHSFFPADRTSHGLLYSLATFGVGFLTRPLGGLVIGGFGDRAGRKPAMMLSFTLMGIAITGMALTPSYARIGVAAPILLIVFRLLGGFALGGEVGPSTAYLIEAAPPRRRGLYVALQYATQDLAVLAAGIVGYVLSSVLDPESLDDWGWRLAFLLGVAIVPVGLIVRRDLPETLHLPDPGAGPPTRTVPVRLIVLGLLMLMATTICSYVLNYITTYAQDQLHMAADLAFGATVVSGLCGVTADPLSGLLSDRIGRRPVMLGGVALLIVLVLPIYVAMNAHLGGIAMFYVVTAVLNLVAPFFTAPALITLTEALPKSVRSGVLATLYAVAISTFGGTTQVTVKYLTDLTGSPLAPAWYLTGALIVGAVAMLLVRETAPVRTG
jgi:MFS family permease